MESGKQGRLRGSAGSLGVITVIVPLLYVIIESKELLSFSYDRAFLPMAFTLAVVHVGVSHIC